MRSAPLLLALLLGCTSAAGKPDDSAARPGGANPTDCGQTHPWVVETVDDVELAGRLAGSVIPWLTLQDGTVHSFAMAFPDDPCLEVVTEGDTVTMTGLCTTAAGVDISGTVVFTGWEQESGSTTYDHFRYDDTAYTGAGYEMDGAWSYADVDEVWTYTVGVEGAFLEDGVETVAGAWSGTATIGGGRWVEESYVDIQSQSGSAAIGDLCYAEDSTASDVCEAEGDGTVTVTGTATGVLTSSGSSCDGCDDVTIDGVSVGTYCG